MYPTRTQSSHLERHRSTHKQKVVVTFTCFHCSQEFAREKELKEHTFVHTNVPPFACTEPQCNKRFLTERKLKRHMSDHQPTIFPCNEPNCYRTFDTRAARRHHVNTAHDARCPHCFKTMDRILLRSHINNEHQGQGLYRCGEPGCNKSFSKSSNLRTHIRVTHQNLRPYKCPEPDCNETFGYKHLSAGELLREERKRPDSTYGELIEGHIKAGSLVPVEITVNLIRRMPRQRLPTQCPSRGGQGRGMT